MGFNSGFKGLITIVYHSHIGSLRRSDDKNYWNLCAIHLENIPNYLSDNLSLCYILVLKVLIFCVVIRDLIIMVY